MINYSVFGLIKIEFEGWEFKYYPEGLDKRLPFSAGVRVHLLRFCKSCRSIGVAIQDTRLSRSLWNDLLATILFPYIGSHPFVSAWVFGWGMYVFRDTENGDYHAGSFDHGLHDTVDTLSGIGESRFRLWLFWWCLGVDQLGDFREEYRVTHCRHIYLPMEKTDFTFYNGKDGMACVFVYHFVRILSLFLLLGTSADFGFSPL